MNKLRQKGTIRHLLEALAWAGSASAPAVATLVLALGAAAQTPAVSPELRARYESAYFAWDRGDYVEALQDAEAILNEPGGEALLQRIALLTGEAFHVDQIAPDGHLLRWSPDGRHFSFETGTGGAAQTHIVSVADAAPTVVTSFGGWGGSFSPDGTSFAFFRIPTSPELERARTSEREAIAAGDFDQLRAARRDIAAMEAAGAEIVVRDVEGGAERILDAADLERFALSYAGEGSVLLTGREPGQGDRIDLFLLPLDGTPRRLTEGPGNKGARIFSAGRDRLVYTVGTDQIAIHDLASGAVQTIAGTAPVVSRDGSTLAFIQMSPLEQGRGEAVVGADVRASGDLYSLMVMPVAPDGTPRELKRTTLPLAEPALSPSGARVAYNTILRDDWEVFVIGSEGGQEERVTREIQHDLFPVFLSEDRLLTLMGEARHRRAYLHEVGGDAAGQIASNPLPGDDQRGRTQVFHNNTIRTVAPQYEWAPSPDGTRIAIVADRDGDTLSPERGVYLVELDREVTKESVLDRIGAQLAEERALRAWGQQTFSPIEVEVRAAVAEVEVGRVYDHAHALYQFGSKFITQPGNALAIEYLSNTLRAMGYEPELQWFEPRPGIHSANVVATLAGTERPERINIVSSHFDSVERAPGADDNTSGTTALLEVARVLAGRPQPETIRFAFLTGEEAGLLGGRELVRRAQAEGDQIVSALNNDMIGWTRSHRLDNTIRYSNDTIRDLQHSAAVLFTDLITYDARYVRSTDAQAFWDAYGDIIGGIGSYPILGNPHYHQPHDQLEVINHQLVAEVAKATIATLMRLAYGIDLDER